jgi:hypothetical protein
MATASQPMGDPAGEPLVSQTIPDSPDLSPSLPPPEPTLLDQRRYWANRAGQSISDLAQAQSTSEDEIAQSILRVRIDNERYSASAAGVAARKLLFAALPKIQSAVDEALSATKLHGKKVVMIDKESGEAVTMEETVEVPDHDIRLRTMSEVRSFFSVVQPRDPAVQIVSNSQTNILNQAAQPAGQLGPGGMTSPEAVIRHVQAERARLLTDGSPSNVPTIIEAAREVNPILEGDSDDDDDLDEDSDEDGSEEDLDEDLDEDE